MAFRDFLPLRKTPAVPEEKKSAQILPVDDQRAIAKNFKVNALAVDFNGVTTGLNSRSTFEAPDVDLSRITKAIDTDSYVKQAMNKYKELMWKEGWEIIGENPEAINYLWQRVDFLEIAMGRSFHSFLVEVADQLVRYGNVFIVKRRGPLQEFFPETLYPPENRDPIIGYYLIPTEQVEILRDRFNKPRWYRQRRDNVAMFSSSDDESPKWNAKDVIHLYWDRKTGRAFGTPFLATALDDVISLRQMEEDIFNLVHRELFPLYKYIIGTDEHPATQEELDNAAFEIEGMRVEGGLILPHRHDVDVIGAQGNALDYSDALAHIKQRVANGLGLYPHHLGMESGANRAATDRLDIALYDKVKTYQQYIADDFVRLNIFNELLLEGGFDPMINPKDKSSVSDRCLFSFNEIDVDTQVKKESHTIQKVQQGLETIGEGRMGLGRTPQMDEADTIAARTVRLAPDSVVQTKRADGSPGAPKTVDTTPKAAQSPALPKGKRGASNMVRPANQHGTRTSPNIRHSVDLGWLTEVENLLGEDYNEVIDVTSREEEND